jgi:hypothetical protein
VIIIPLVFVTLAANKILRFILAILMRLLDYAFPLAIADCLASALRGQGCWQCYRYCHERRVALLSPFRDETSTVEHIDPSELVVAPAED